VLDLDGRILDAGWTRGLDETVERVVGATGESALLFVDAPLVVDNLRGQRKCETQVGQRYGRWKVSANTTNLGASAARSGAGPADRTGARRELRRLWRPEGLAAAQP